MKKFPLLLFFVLTFAFNVSAQTNQTYVCPTLDVTGGGTTKPGTIVTFKANLGNYDLSKLSFDWIVSQGEILEGQGTLEIKVLQPDNGENLTATAEIIGLPEGCQNADSETGPVCGCARPRLFDEFSISQLRIDKARLDYLVKELGNNPNAQAFIIEYFKPRTPKRIINRKIQKITDYLVNQMMIVKGKFTILTADSENAQNRTKFWIVPPGANVPQP